MPKVLTDASFGRLGVEMRKSEALILHPCSILPCLRRLPLHRQLEVPLQLWAI